MTPKTFFGHFSANPGKSRLQRSSTLQTYVAKYPSTGSLGTEPGTGNRFRFVLEPMEPVEPVETTEPVEPEPEPVEPEA